MIMLNPHFSPNSDCPDEELTTADIAELQSRARSLEADIDNPTTHLSDGKLIWQIHNLVKLPSFVGLTTPYDSNAKSIHEMTRTEKIASARAMIHFILSL